MLSRFRDGEVNPRAGVFLLTPVKTSHAAAVFDFLNRNAGRFTGPFPLTMTAAGSSLSGAQEWARQKMQMQAEDQGLVLLTITPDGIVAGCVTAFHFDWRVPKCELAWMVDEAYEGAGLISASLRQLIGFLEQACEVKKLLCRTVPGNERSAWVARACGFTEEGMHRRDFRDGHGELVDVVYWGRCN